MRKMDQPLSSKHEAAPQFYVLGLLEYAWLGLKASGC